MSAQIKKFDFSGRSRAGVGAVGPQISGSACGNDAQLNPARPECQRFREYPVGFGRDAIAAGATAEIVVTPQIDYKPDRLMVPSNIAPDFDILDIKVGKNSQLPTSEQPIDAIAFSEVSMGACVDMDTAVANSRISLLVRNKSAVPQDFRAILFGTAVDS